MYVSKVKKELVSEALKIWDDSNKNIELFKKALVSGGWKATAPGSFKNCFWKNSIIVKFSSRGDDKTCNLEIQREWEQRRYAPKGLKKHFPKIHAYKDDLIIQDRVILKCDQVSTCDMNSIKNSFNLKDAAHNHGHSINGNVKFFDWVYFRTGKYLELKHKNVRLGK